eukprot:TRINITY_DN4666_c0_g1_i1.p1 TRINITY_DN4666_c0_g1~~TRINITY_DN4666_c0_g1_i1.p1  ORF type:complete len:179 (-),score=40.95 TRINITY_DN4666_c0_g1_i1:71-607(-)
MTRPAKRKKIKRQKAQGYVLKKKKKSTSVHLPLTRNAQRRVVKGASAQANYGHLGLSYDPNATIKYEIPQDIEADEFVVPDDPTKSELAPLLKIPEAAPKKKPNLGIRERWYFKRLHDKWGQDYKAMARDIKLNPNQYTPTICKKRIGIYVQYYKERLEKIEKKKAEQLENEKTKSKK